MTKYLKKRCSKYNVTVIISENLKKIGKQKLLICLHYLTSMICNDFKVLISFCYAY